MNKFFFAVFLFLVSGNFVVSQSYSGVITKNNVEVRNLKIVIENLKLNEKYTSTTNEKGRFYFELKNFGDYKITVYDLEKLVFENNIHLTKSIDETIVLPKHEKLIEGIEIKNHKKIIERQPDKLVFNIENVPTLMGGDATDALKIVPGVLVKGDDVLLVGKSNVKVMVDDKIIPLVGEDIITFLKNIPAENIKKIEVITNPTAKYDAEGNYGLINIVLKKSIRNNWNMNVRSSYQQATKPTFNNGVGFSFRKNKIAILSDIGYKDSQTMYNNDITYQYPTENWINTINNKTNNKNYNYLLNLNYEIDKMKSLGVQVLGNYVQSNEKGNLANSSYANNMVTKYFKTVSNTNAKPQNLSLNINFTQKFDSLGKKMNIDFDYFNTKNGKNTAFNTIQNYFSPQSSNNIFAQNDNNRNGENLALKFDFEFPLKWFDLSFGAKISRTKIDNNQQSDFTYFNNNSLDTYQTDSFTNTENLQALYFNFDKKISDKWDLKVGLRNENNQSKLESYTQNSTNENKKTNFFPTLYILYTANENSMFSINYGKRIERPSYSALNPAKWYLNPKSYVEGNPFLQPTYSHSIEFGYYYKEIFSFSLNYVSIKNNSGQLIYHDIPNETQIYRTENYTNGQDFVGTLSLYKDLFPWWNTSTSVVIGYSEITPFVDILQKKYSGWYAYTSSYNTFTINKNKTLLATLYFEYSYPAISGFSRKGASSTLDIGFRYLCLDKKLSLGLNFEDILKTDYSTTTNNSSGIDQTYKQYYDTQLFRFSVSYKFGNKKINVEKKENSNDEINRMK